MIDKKDVEVKVFASPKEYSSRDLRDEPRVANIIRERVLPLSDAEYYRVDVKIKRDRDLAPQYLVAYLLRKDIYLAEVVKVSLDENYQVSDIEFDYTNTEDDDDEEEGRGFIEEGYVGEDFEEEASVEEGYTEDTYEYAFDFVVATPVPDITSAKAAVEWLHKEATKAGLKSKMLLGAEASVNNYQLYLTSGVKAFVNIGHGNPSGIVLHDGTLSASWLQTLSAKPLSPAVVYFNSCQVHNDPLKSAAMNAGARTFIGGIVNLLIGASEEVCKCFWGKVLNSASRMDDALHQCEKNKYPKEGAHGIVGDTGPFTAVSLKLAHAMWAHGNGMQIEYPDRIDSIWRAGFYIRVKGKPFTSNWFHFAIPTPVIVDGKRLRVGSVMVRFRTGPGASIHAIHIYDGETKIAAHDGLNLSSNSFVWPRFDVPTHPLIKWGLGISIGVTFGDGANLPDNKLRVEISSAGCDFVEIV